LISPAGGVGPGKIRLLELIDETGSTSAAGRAMAMSYPPGVAAGEDSEHQLPRAGGRYPLRRPARRGPLVTPSAVS